MKSYTDIEQSKKLAEILPLESADMHYAIDIDFMENERIPTVTEEDDHFKLFQLDIPCWSLAALLEIIPGSELSKSVDYNGKWEASAWKDPDLELLMRVDGFDNPIDACYDMILKLRELKIL